LRKALCGPAGYLVVRLPDFVSARPVQPVFFLSNFEIKKILFISHYAGRTGAPLMLLNFLTWMKENSNISFEFLLRALYACICRQVVVRLTIQPGGA